jgi:AraC-like DNA-binding protein
MIFEFTARPDFDFITEFSQKYKIAVNNNTMVIPDQIGEGFIRKIAFNEGFRLLMHRYRLKEDFTIIRNPSQVPNDLISIFFYNNEQPIDLIYNSENPVKFSRKNDSAIQVTTSDLNSIIKFPAHSETYYMVVGITAKKLSELLGIDQPNTIIKTITSGTSSFLYFESMSAEVQQVLKHIASINLTDPLSNFHIQIKVQELLYHLFSTLSKRESTVQKPLNNADVEKLMVVRNAILSDLSIPPLTSSLAAMVAMSETKLKQLFRQTFGDSIYNYYQKIRMEEAAFLLKQGNQSVSEIGYELGFSNLSHFSRLFEKHYGITPKKFTTTR